MLLTDLAQLLEIPHLADGRAPLHEQPLVQAPAGLQWRRPRLESDGITCHGGKVPVVQPADSLFAILDADGYAVVLGAAFALFRAVEAGRSLAVGSLKLD